MTLAWETIKKLSQKAKGVGSNHGYATEITAALPTFLQLLHQPIKKPFIIPSFGQRCI